MVRSRVLKRRAQSRRWDTALLNAMVWDPWKPTPVARGSPLNVRSDGVSGLTGTSSESAFLNLQEPAGTITRTSSNRETAAQLTTERDRVNKAETETGRAPPTHKDVNNDSRHNNAQQSQQTQQTQPQQPGVLVHNALSPVLCETTASRTLSGGHVGRCP